jgi:hypothetical protein
MAKRVTKLTPIQRVTVGLLNRLEEMVNEFNEQGAENQSTQLSGLLDDYYMAVEEQEDKTK